MTSFCIWAADMSSGGEDNDACMIGTSRGIEAVTMACCVSRMLGAKKTAHESIISNLNMPGEDPAGVKHACKYSSGPMSYWCQTSKQVLVRPDVVLVSNIKASTRQAPHRAVRKKSGND